MADRLDYFFRQRVTEAELDLGFELLEKADRNIAADIGLFGVITGAEPSPHTPVADLTIDLTAPTRAYDELGQRIFFGTSQIVNCAVDYAGIPTEVPLPGQERWLGVFLKFDRLLSDPRTDGNSQDVYFRRDESFAFVVRQGPPAPVGAATKVPLVAGELLLCDVRRQNGQLQIQNADIDVARRQAFVFAQADSVEIVSGSWSILDPAVNTVQSGLDEVDAELAGHFAGTARRHAATAVDIAPHGFVAAGNVEAAVHELIDDLSSSTSGAAGALRVGADAVPGTPNALPAGNVDGQLSQLLGWLNSHVGAASGAHAASAITAAVHNYIAGTSVQAQLQEIVTTLLAQTAGTPGSLRIGADAVSGTPNSLTAGTVDAQLSTLLGDINTHITNATGAHAASAVSYAGQTGAASTAAPTYSAPANPVEDALDFLLGEVNKRVAKAGDSITGTLDLGSGRVATGLDIGFQTGTPLADQLRVGDTNFYLYWNGTDPLLNFDTGNDRLLYSRSANAFQFQVAGTTEMQVNASGASIENGLYVGSAGGTPTDNGIVAEGGLTVGTTTAPVDDTVIIGVSNFRVGWNGTDPYVQFDDAGGLDRILFDRSADEYLFDINGVTELRLGTGGIQVTNGAVVGFSAAPTDDALLVADANFGLVGGTVPELRFDSSDRIRYDRAGDRMIFSTSGVDVLAITQRSLSGTSFYNQRRSSTSPFLDDTTSGTFMTNSLGLSGSNLNGTLVVNGNSTNNAPNVRINYYGGYSPGGKGLVIDAAGFVDARRAHMNLEPFAVTGVGSLPDIDVATGDIFAAADYAPDRLYFYNGSAWVQMA